MSHKKRSVAFVMNILLLGLIGNLFLIQETQARGQLFMLTIATPLDRGTEHKIIRIRQFNDGITAATDGDIYSCSAEPIHENVDITKDVT